MKVYQRILAAALAASLAACGGGGSSNTDASTTNTTSTQTNTGAIGEYLGLWLTNGENDACEVIKSIGNTHYYGKRSADTLEISTEVEKWRYIRYSDNVCATKVVDTTWTRNIEWSVVNVAGRTNVLKVKTTYKDIDYGGLEPINHFKPSNADLTPTKNIWDIDGGKLYLGKFVNAQPSPADVDGYPTEIDPTDFYLKKN